MSVHTIHLIFIIALIPFADHRVHADFHSSIVIRFNLIGCRTKNFCQSVCFSSLTGCEYAGHRFEPISFCNKYGSLICKIVSKYWTMNNFVNNFVTDSNYKEESFKDLMIDIIYIFVQSSGQLYIFNISLDS